MTGHHFISYSSVDGKEFALKLHDALEAPPDKIPAWFDKRDLMPGSSQNWDTQLAEAIRDCASLLFVMTADSVDDKSVCKLEWSWALKYKKPVLPLLLDKRAELPFRLDGRQYIDFSQDFDSGMA